ncbi:sulfatase-like hydrolase/transferase [Pontiella sulfatireligans]|nr:sulfatase-like hydrolase/transferase [Pontiella sulfatireligans]
MKLKSCFYLMSVFLVGGAFPAQAVNLVDFDADTISSAINQTSDLLFSESSTTLDSISSPGYTGQSVYGGFEEEGESMWSANNRANAGLKVRWNAGAGIAGEASSGLYLFEQEDFLNGLDSGLILMDAAGDTVSGEAGYINPNGAVSSTTIRFVLKDSSGYHISAPQPLVSCTVFSFEATTLSYFSFTPTANTSTEAGIIGGVSTPTFSGITWVGFRIDAVRGATVANGVNIGVELFSVQGASAPTATVVDGGLRHQKIEGFGASGAFYINRLISNNNSTELANLLFRDLSLDIFRIQNVYDHDGYVNKVDDTVATIQLGEAALGKPLKILMSSWTPPAYLKSTGSQAGSDDATLDSDVNGYRYGDYAAWWADSLDYYNSEGVDADYISIQNEPNWHPDYNSCGFEPVETTNFAGYNKVFEAVWQELALRKGTVAMPKMLGPETISFNKLDAYIDNLIHPFHAYGFAHHYYQNNVGENPDVLNSNMAEFNTDYGYKPLFQTEYCVLDANTNSPLVRKLNLARLMHNALTIEEVSSYFYWSLYWNGEQGLIDIPDSSSYIITPEYYAFKHFSAFINADWRRLDAVSSEDAIDISAYISPDETKVTVVIVNDDTSTAHLDISFVDISISGGDIYRSTDAFNCTNIGVFNPAASVAIPAESITTLDLSATPPSAPANPNILMICVDDLRPETRGYGAAQMITPNMDQLASDGYQFNRAYVQQAVCSPSRTSLMTGMRPDSTQVFDLTTNFRDTIPWVETLPQYLQDYGYYSVGIGKVYHGNLNDDLSWSEPWSSGPGVYGSLGPGNPPTECTNVTDNVYRDGAVTDEAILKLADLKTKQPFFYGVGYVRPHLPFVAPQTYWDMYTTNDLVLPHTDDHAVDASTFAYTSWGELRNYDGIPATGPVSDAQEKELIHGYYASVSYMDAQLGRLMAGLEAEGLADNTIVVVWGDHGWHLGDHGQWTKHTNFERATRIPMIVKVPWMPGASQIDALTEAVDLYPTLLDLCGIPHPVQLEGDSLVPLLQNPDSTGDDDALSQYPRSGNMGYSMRTDRYRYTEWRVQNSNIFVERELYDHFLDPREDTNVVAHAEYADDVASLEAQLQARLDELNPPSNASGDNLVVNGEFEDGLNNWSENIHADATVSFATVGAAPDLELYVDITDGTTSPYKIALEQIVPAQAGKLYTFRFEARAAADRELRILWRNKNNNTNAYLQLDVPIDTVSRSYEFTGIQLDYLSGVDPDAEIRLQFGGDDADVWIDSIEIYAETSFAATLVEAGLSGADALLDADADSDTVINLFEYAFNLDMTTNDYHVLLPGIGTSGLPTYQIADTNSFQALELEYLRRCGAYDLEYIPEFTSNLVSNVWISPVLTETVVPIDSDWERVTVRDLETTETATNRFGRIRILFKP